MLLACFHACYHSQSIDKGSWPLPWRPLNTGGFFSFRIALFLFTVILFTFIFVFFYFFLDFYRLVSELCEEVLLWLSSCSLFVGSTCLLFYSNFGCLSLTVFFSSLSSVKHVFFLFWHCFPFPIRIDIKCQNCGGTLCFSRPDFLERCSHISEVFCVFCVQSCPRQVYVSIFKLSNRCHFAGICWRNFSVTRFWHHFAYHCSAAFRG